MQRMHSPRTQRLPSTALPLKALLSLLLLVLLLLLALLLALL